MTDEKPKQGTGLIHEKLTAIMQEVGAIGKDGENVQQRFKFRSIEAVCNRLHGLLGKHGVTIVPRMLEQKREILDRFDKRDGKKIGHWVLTCITMSYTFGAEDGSAIEVVVPGEAADTGDKASNKAMSAALKYALCQTFCIPTVESDAGPGDGNNVSSAADKLLQNKTGAAGKHQPPPDPAEDAKQKLMVVCQQLSNRDCHNLKLTRQDCGDLYRSALTLSGAKEGDYLTVAKWMQDNAQLGVEVDSEGAVQGVKLTVKEPQPA